MFSGKENKSTTDLVWRDRNLLLVFAVTLSAVMGVSLITPVFPQIVEVFGIEKQQVTLLIIAFALPGVLISPVYGIIADRWGRKRVLVPLLLLFGIAGAACGFARSFWMLIVFRFIQGLGSGGLFTLNNTIIGDLFSGRSRYQAMGMNAAVISISAAMYPALGGGLAMFHWRVPFFLPGIAVLVAFLVATLLDSPEITPQDSLGGYLGEAYRDMRKWRIIRLFVISLFTFMLSFGPFISFIPLWMAERYHSSAATIGWVISLASLSAAVVSARLGWFKQHMLVCNILGSAFLVYALVFWAVPNVPSAMILIIPALAYGAAQGLNIPTVQAVLAGSALHNYRGVFMSINSMVILCGITLGPLLASIIYKFSGFRTLHYIAGAVSFVIALLLFLFGKGIKEEHPESSQLAGTVVGFRETG